ncbi:hypothetical protein, partial [Pseudoalteromonas sp.]|uniref:hypothetical protein n=1 Tax=Pseudoalteromonas sp. TaxID=53249 RepID=UPI00262E7803
GGMSALQAAMMMSFSGQTVHLLQFRQMRDEGECGFNKSVDKMASYQRSKLVLNFDAVVRAGRAGLFGCSNLTFYFLN